MTPPAPRPRGVGRLALRAVVALAALTAIAAAAWIANAKLAAVRAQPVTLAIGNQSGRTISRPVIDALVPPDGRLLPAPTILADGAQADAYAGPGPIRVRSITFEAPDGAVLAERTIRPDIEVRRPLVIVITPEGWRVDTPAR